MKISVNKEYRARHALVALVLAAIGGWFFYDGFVAWPAENDAWRSDPANKAAVMRWDAGETPKNAPENERPPHEDGKVRGQIAFGSALCLASLVIAALLAHESFKTLEWNEKEGWMKGSLTGGRRVDFSEVADLDLRKWESKRIARARLANGRKVVLDGWHHVGVSDLLKHLRDDRRVPFDD